MRKRLPFRVVFAGEGKAPRCFGHIHRFAFWDEAFHFSVKCVERYEQRFDILKIEEGQWRIYDFLTPELNRELNEEVEATLAKIKAQREEEERLRRLLGE